MTDASTTTGSFDALLEQERWLYSLARRLTIDDASARDLVQQTLMAALENPPRDRALRPWLATVVRRVAGKTRLRRVPQLSDLQDSLAEGLSPADAAQLSEAKARLRDAVAGLEESLRVTVHLSYVNGLSRAEIASALGVTERTVRNRLEASYVHIRYSLGSDLQCDGQTPAWGAALAPLLGHQAKLRATTAPAVAGAGLVLGSVLAAAALAVLLHDSEQPSSGDTASRVAIVATDETTLPPDAPGRSGLSPAESRTLVQNRPPTGKQAVRGGAAGSDLDGNPDREPAEATEERFRMRGTALLNGRIPDGFEAFIMPAGWTLTLGSIPEQRCPLSEDGSFEVAAAETGHWSLLVRPQKRRGGSPAYRIQVELAPGNEDQEVALDVSTGEVVVSINGHEGQPVWLWAPSTSWEYISVDNVNDGTAAFRKVPEGEFTVRFKQNDDVEEYDEYLLLGTGWVNAGETTDIRVPKPR